LKEPGKMDLGISDRVALVTGASAGIGFAVATELIENDACVVIVARGEARLRAAEASLRSRTKRKVLAIVADVSSPDAPQSIVDQVVSQFGRLDILVNNAGRAHAGGLLESSEQDWTEMTSIKLSAMRRLCKAAVPVMRGRRWGRIVNISSIGGIYPNPKLLISHVLSAAINNFTKSLALEVAADGILVNAIGCGAIATDNWANNMTPAVRRARPELVGLSDQQLLAKIAAELTPVGRAGSPREIAAIAAFLASDRNGFVTGDTIEASGGADRFM
jgi:3-oxoacyl-[acyl-carrier protein] reductase